MLPQNLPTPLLKHVFTASYNDSNLVHLEWPFFFWERERGWAHAWAGGGEAVGGAEGEEERTLSRFHLRLSAEPEAGLDVMTLRSWPELKSRVKHLTDWAPLGTLWVTVLMGILALLLYWCCTLGQGIQASGQVGMSASSSLKWGCY